MTKTHPLCLLLLAASLTLSSCAYDIPDYLVDPSFAAYETAVENNPSPNAILGMWHRVDTRTISFGPGDAHTSKSATSMLFRSDKTAILKTKAKSGSSVVDMPPTSFLWKYLGDGNWSFSAQNPGATSKFRVAGDKLLFYSDSQHGSVRHVYTRAQ